MPKDTSPNKSKKEVFYSDSSDNSSTEDESHSEQEQGDDEEVDLDEDHSLLLKSCLPLLQSRNSGVVLAVARIYFHLAPSQEAQHLAKPLVRLLRSHRELQYIVLTNIATMACSRPVSESHVACTHVKQLHSLIVHCSTFSMVIFPNFMSDPPILYSSGTRNLIF
jgi:hypothetical protein